MDAALSRITILRFRPDSWKRSVTSPSALRGAVERPVDPAEDREAHNASASENEMDHLAPNRCGSTRVVLRIDPLAPNFKGTPGMI